MKSSCSIFIKKHLKEANRKALVHFLKPALTANRKALLRVIKYNRKTLVLFLIKNLPSSFVCTVPLRNVFKTELTYLLIKLF